MTPDRHLDLGCGDIPRNPYARAHVCGVDIREVRAASAFEYRRANLMLEPIPWPDDSFASVSAYNFVEHVPRVIATADHGGTVFPFVRLMDEVWRVLVPGGRLYAVTPAYPHVEAFVDPTHVNIITARTHEYFCGEDPEARMYGFRGRFEPVRVAWTHLSDALSAVPGSPENRQPATGLRRVAHGLRGVGRLLRGKSWAGRRAFLLWELRAVKPAT